MLLLLPSRSSIQTRLSRVKSDLYEKRSKKLSFVLDISYAILYLPLVVSRYAPKIVLKLTLCRKFMPSILSRSTHSGVPLV